MRFAINVPCFAAFGDARALASLAHEAEEAGWDGFFLWDHIGAEWPVPFTDPWIALAAMAAATSRITLGPLVTPLPRRRPQKVAREAVALDHLSGGRLILGVGIGSDSGHEYSCYGEATDDALHAAMLDEALVVITGLWTGETFSYSGQHYTLRDARFLPPPVQQPRVPIWLAGMWPNKRPFRRAARWDGVVPLGKNEQPLAPADFRNMLDYIRSQRGDTGGFDVVGSGYTGNMEPERAAEMLRDYADAGVTWWQEGLLPDDPIEAARDRIRQGPPRV